MRILTISPSLPIPDQASGDLRLFTLLALMAKSHSVSLCVLYADDQIEEMGTQSYSAYVNAIQSKGVRVSTDLAPLLRSETWDVVLFEFYEPAIKLIDEVRFRQPCARVVIDSVDVHFRRHAAKATISGSEADAALADKVKREELRAYNSADTVIAVTEDDKSTLSPQIRDVPIYVLPNVHKINTPMDPMLTKPNSMIFVGGFKHEPNVDAMHYFCKNVLPLIRDAIPTANLTIVGSHPPVDIQALASDHIEVTGYVPDTSKYLRGAAISIAPLRYGAGMKGKIGEAMSHGLPIVTTTIGAEGFGLVAGKDLLVGDSAREFALHVINLLRDPKLYNTIRLNGWRFIRNHYSIERVEQLCHETLAAIQTAPVHKLPRFKRIRRAGREFYERNVAWRFR